MKTFALLCTLCWIGSASLAIAEEAPPSVVQLAQSTLAALGEDPVIVAAVRAQNAAGTTLAQIQEADEVWKNTPGIDDGMVALMNSECAKRLREIQNAESFYSEIFVMDALGANVAMTDKTSDYWQGDEAKFERSFAGGEGAVFVDDVEFDESSQNYLVQVSVPVLDGGRAIGAITFGINVDELE